MATRGERAPERSDAILPIFLGCGALVVLMCGGGFAAYSLLRIPPAVALPSSGPPVALPVVAPTSAPVLPATVVATPEAEPPPTDVGHGGSGFYNPSAGSPDPDPQAVTIHEGAEVTGALSPDVIRRVVMRHIAEVRGCYEHSLRSDPGLTARVVAHFTIGPDGSVTTATVDGSSDAALTTCIASRVRAWVFPTPAGGGIVSVNYPFVFTAS